MELNTPRAESLAGRLQRIEDLAEKLVYIKWSQEFFLLLQRAAQDVVEITRSAPEYQKVLALAERLEQQVSESLAKGTLPKGAERDQLIAIVDALCRTAPISAPTTPAGARTAASPTVALFSKWEGGEWTPAVNNESTVAQELALWLVAPESMRDLVHKLQQRGGFQVQRCENLDEVDTLLAQSQQPAALIIDADVSDGDALLGRITHLRQTLAPEIPIFFLADRGDITARLDAVTAGGSGYFSKPVNIPLLLESLDERVLRRRDHRVLIVDDDLPSAREIARWLENRGLVTHVLAQPLHLLQVIRNFQPNLILLSLDLKEVDGLALTQAIQQHEQLRGLPLILLSQQPDSGQRLSVAGVGGETLLNKPLNSEVLFVAISKRLRQGYGWYRKLNQLSNRDTVSGLHNRPYFLARLERALSTTATDAHAVAVMLITLDNLRVVESLDVAAADEIVEQAAKRLQAALGVEPVAARFGDVIFAVLLGFTQQDTLLATARAVQATLETETYRLHGSDIQLRTSIGISVATPAMREAALLIQQADLACDMARDSKGARIHVHHGQTVPQDMDNPRQRKLLDEIREAVQHQRLNLLFQPIVSLRGDTTERYEVLLRMRNHEGWELLPETVFGLVKRNRIGMVLDRWVIANSIRVLRERQGGGQSCILFINMSPTILQDEELFDWLKSGLQKTGVPAASLVFEIAETTAEVNKQTLLPFLRRFKELGCALSLDHFSGHERGQALAQILQVDYVKLDNRYVQGLLNDKIRQQELSRLTRNLSAQGITAILTGVEDAATLPILWSCGIDFVQGFFLQRPHTEMSYDFQHLAM